MSINEWLHVSGVKLNWDHCHANAPLENSWAPRTMGSFLRKASSFVLLNALLSSGLYELIQAQSPQNSVADKDKIDCYPENGNQTLCEDRGCTWDESHVKVTIAWLAVTVSFLLSSLFVTTVGQVEKEEPRSIILTNWFVDNPNESSLHVYTFSGLTFAAERHHWVCTTLRAFVMRADCSTVALIYISRT